MSYGIFILPAPYQFNPALTLSFVVVSTGAASSPGGVSLRLALRAARHAQAAALRSADVGHGFWRNSLVVVSPQGPVLHQPVSLHTSKPLQAAARALSDALRRGLLVRFMPQDAQAQVHAALAEAGLQGDEPYPTQSSVLGEDKEQEVQGEGKEVVVGVSRGVLRIGRAQHPLGRGAASASARVPRPLFFPNAHHMRLLEAMLEGWALGDHVLLIGNQGVGKNKLADRFLQLMNRGREYLQLHRDSTVASLTLRPVLQGGRLAFEDSPLVAAAVSGAVLVLDEVDKAPVEVVAALRTLLADGEMALADGRRLARGNERASVCL